MVEDDHTEKYHSQEDNARSFDVGSIAHKAPAARYRICGLSRGYRRVGG